MNTFHLIPAAALLIGLSNTVLASDWSVGGEVTLTSDYYDRGGSENDANPALQAGISVSHNNGLYFKLWGSPVSDTLYNGSSLEVDAGLGWSGPINENGLQLSLEAMHFQYPGSSVDSDNFNEYMIGLEKDLGGPTVSGNLYYSDDLGGAGTAYYWDFNASIPAGPVELGLHYGLNRFDDPAEDDYEDYAIGLSKDIAGINADLSYRGARGVDGPCGWRDCKERAVLTLTKEF